MNNVDEKLAPYGALVLRVGLGVMWIAHALLKWFVFTIPGVAAWLDTQGLPSELAWPLFIVELAGGLAILLGIYGRYVALLMIPIMAVVTWTHFPNGSRLGIRVCGTGAHGHRSAPSVESATGVCLSVRRKLRSTRRGTLRGLAEVG